MSDTKEVKAQRLLNDLISNLQTEKLKVQKEFDETIAGLDSQLESIAFLSNLVTDAKNNQM